MYDNDTDEITKLIEWHTPEVHRSSHLDRADRLASEASTDVSVDGLEHSIT